MEKILRSIYFESLKGLKDFELKFTKPLTAIMGINGSGKTTILHALACVYRPERNGQNNKFSNFFIPNPHSVWEGSKLRIRYRQGEITKSGMKRIRTREYYKRTSRWAPDYSTRPIRDTFYLGIDSCLPEIEKQKKYTYFHYTTEELDDRISKKIIEKASYILNKDYFILTTRVWRHIFPDPCGARVTGPNHKNVVLNYLQHLPHEPTGTAISMI